jgi:hypothetical protein
MRKIIRIINHVLAFIPFLAFITFLFIVITVYLTDIKMGGGIYLVK